MPSRPKSKEEYFAAWDDWAREAPLPTDFYYRKAVNILKAWLEADQPDVPLNLSELALASLPPLPDTLRELNVRHNQLDSLPPLPDTLKALNVGRNRLISLPELPATLEYLDVEDNELDSLPPLPNTLNTLNVGCNRLISLPELPVSLEYLDVRVNLLPRLPETPLTSLQHFNATNNRLASLPENITVILPDGCGVWLDNNPLPDRVLNNLRAIVSAADYSGPYFLFSMAHASDTAPARPLADAIADWHDEGQEHVGASWKAFALEEGAPDFSRFLDRLRNTVNYGNPAFRQSAVEWLSHLAGQPQLRKDTFLISAGATESCEDRVSLTFNEMKKARVASDVEHGRYDEQLPELIALARGMYRLDKLEKIAREKVQSLRLVDEIEVYLAYQVKLRDKLALPLDTPDMRFFGASYVTQEDLDQAEEAVKASENKDFMHYLSTDWQPWQAVLKRLHGARYDEAQHQITETMGDEFTARLEARLKEGGLQHDDDARRIVGSQVKDEIAHEINDALTREFLTAQKMSHLLAPSWP